MKTLLKIFTFVLLLAPSLGMAEQLAFFTALPDIPVKEGLVELSDQTLSFDKPGGRIIETIALIEDGTEQDIRRYYVQSLPQLGWERHNDDTFKRGSEHLKIIFESFENKRFVRFMLAPS